MLVSKLRLVCRIKNPVGDLNGGDTVLPSRGNCQTQYSPN